MPLLDEYHCRMLNEQRAEMMAAIQAAQDGPGEDAEAVRGCQVVSTMWCDPARQDDTALGGFGCWGDNITDVRLEKRSFRRLPDGTKTSQTKWELCQILQISGNTADSRAVMEAKHFKMIDTSCKTCTTSLMIPSSASKSKARIHVEEGRREGTVTRILRLNVRARLARASNGRKVTRRL